MAKCIESRPTTAALAIVLVLAMAACGGSRPAPGAAGVSEPRPAETEYCSQRPICFQPGFADGAEETTPQAQPSECTAEGTVCVQR